LLPRSSAFPHISIVTLVDLSTSSFPGAGDVWFSLSGTPYQNNSIVILEEIGEGSDALLCITNLTICCHHDNTGGSALGHWFFPNGTRVPSPFLGEEWDLYRTRGQVVVRLNRRRGGVEGIYRCEIPVAMNFTQTIYIGVYSASTGEWWLCVHSVLHCKSTMIGNTCSSVLIVLYVQNISGLQTTWFTSLYTTEQCYVIVCLKKPKQ